MILFTMLFQSPVKLFKSVFVFQLLMVCERRFLAPHAKMVVMAGMFAGSLLSGPLSDM